MILLVGFDGSNSSKAALELACIHAKAFNAAIEIITSMQQGNADDVADIKVTEELLKWAESFTAKNGVKVETHLLIRGMTPGEDVVRFARDNAVDTIFIGVKRRSKVGKLIFGSNAQYIILKAPCPVMTVK